MHNLETKNAPEGVGLADIQKAIETHAAATAATVDGLKASIAATAATVDGLKANLLELEQKTVDGLKFIPGAGVSLADTLIKNSAWDAVANKRLKSTSIEVKASELLSVKAVTYDGGGLAVRENVGIVGEMQRKKWLRDRLVTAFTSGGSVEYSRETFTNAADVQGGGSPFLHESVQKPESTISYELIDSKVPTIAHWVKASRQILADVAGLQQVLTNRLLYGVNLKLEQQILNGTGVGAQMSGLFKSGNYVPFTPTTGETGIDSISRALGILAGTYEAMPDLILLNPIDYRSMQRTKAVDSGVFLWGNPNGADSDQVWAVPIHPSPAVTVTKFAVLDSRQMGTLRIRDEARVEIGYDGNDFTSNMLTLLGELRAVITVERPTATMYGSLTT